MKRIASLIICAVVVLSSAVIFALPASAAEKVVYVSDKGTGDGSSATSALGTLDAAYNALAATGGTIKIVDTITIKYNTAVSELGLNENVGDYYSAPAHERQITITSADNANKGSLVFDLECPWYALSGPTVFENIKICKPSAYNYARFLARGNHITMGDGLEMYNDDVLSVPADVFNSAMQGFVIQGITNIGAEYDGYMDDNTWITIKSGVYFLVQGYTRNYVDTGDLTGNCYMEFLGDFAVRQMGWANLKKGYTCSGQAYIYWNCNITNWRIFPGYDVATDPFTVNLFIDGGNHLNEVGSTQKFVGAGKVKTINLWYNQDSTAASDFADFIVGNYIITQLEGGVFPDELKNYKGEAYRPTEDVAPLDVSAPAVTEPAPTTTVAPTTTAAPAVTTVAPAQPEPTPSTGDSSVMVVFAAAAVICVAAVVVIKKKEN